MKSKTSLSIVCFCACLMLASCSQSNKGSWEVLFNGHNLDGWRMVGSKGIAVVSDSAIVCSQVADTNEHTFVCTNEKYSDFILEMDIKTDSKCNSGILLRASEQAPEECEPGYVSLYGYQVKLDSQLERKWTGGIFYDFGNSWRWLYSLEHDERARNAHRVGEWNHFRIEAIGSSIKVWVNDIPVTHLINSDYKEGYIALKIHSLPPHFKDQTIRRGRYKNIRIITQHPEKHAMAMDIPALEVQ